MHNTLNVDAYFSALSAAVAAREASLESNLEVMRRDEHDVQRVFWKKTAICMFCRSEAESEHLKV